MAVKGSLSTTALPNMVSGVSQQPPTLRLVSNSAEQINCWPSVVTGLNKRPNTEHIAKLADLSSDNAVGYLIDRDDTYQYIVVISGDDLQVFDLMGNAQTVTFPNDKSYISTAADPATSFRFCTIGDTTFILNRDVVPLIDDFGEVGTYNFAYTTVADDAAMNAITGTVGQIVFNTAAGSFYQWRDSPAIPAIVAWTAGSVGTVGAAGAINNNNATPLTTYTIVASLPATATVGAKYQIKTLYGTTNGTCASYDSKGNCQVYNKLYRYYYKGYIGAQTRPATPAVFGWTKMKGNELDRDVDGRLDPTNMATVYITQSIANVNYTMYYNGTLVAFYLTPKGVDASTSVPGTDQICASLQAAITTATTASPGTLLPLGYTMTRYGSTLSFNGLDEGCVITVSASNGDKAIKGYTTEIDSFTNLPPNEAPGRIIKVRGDVKDNGDDYYVLMNAKNQYEETVNWNCKSRFFPSTMPHTLVRNSDGTWVFGEHDWDERAAGDLESNPSPSFVGAEIHDMFLYSDRLTFLADENLIFSEANSFENFWRTSIAAIVDSDVIDLAVLSSGVDKLWHGIPYNDDLLLMSDRNQHRFAYQNFLGPKNIQIKYTTSFNVSRDVRPVNMGGTVYFLDDKAEYKWAKQFEYFPQANLTGDDANETSGPVPEYLASGIIGMAGSPRVKAMILNPSAVPDSLYLYKYYWGTSEKIQNAWGTWQFPDTTKVLWAGFNFNYLYLLMRRPDGFFIERIKCEETVSHTDANTKWLIDRTAPVTGLVYNPANNTTLVTLPWANTNGTVEIMSDRYNLVIRTEDNYTDRRHTIVSIVSPTQVIVDGDVTDATAVRCGIRYEQFYRFSKPYVRKPGVSGPPVVLDTTRLQMKYLNVFAENTAAYTVTIKYPGRPDRVMRIDHMLADDETVVIGGSPARSWKDRIALAGNNEDITVELSNSTPFNAQFTAAEWQFVTNTRAKNRM